MEYVVVVGHADQVDAESVNKRNSLSLKLHWLEICCHQLFNFKLKKSTDCSGGGVRHEPGSSVQVEWIHLERK